MSGSKVYIDCEELAARIAEAAMANTRPAGASGSEAMRQLDTIDHVTANRFRLAARAAAHYIAECVNAENPGQVEVVEVVVNETKGVPS